MTTLTVPRNRTVFDEHRVINWLSPRIGVFCSGGQSEREAWKTLEDLREDILEHDGQFISLDLAELSAKTFSEMFYAALKNVRWDCSLQISLPIILQHNPRVATPFLNYAIQWQRLCDLVIVDDEPSRKAVAMLENVGQASPAVQHEIARMIRFHTVHFIHRIFVFTLDDHSHDQIIPELRDILGIQ